MFERMLDKQKPPSETEITDHIGKKHQLILDKIENELISRYDLIRELRFPFGNSYGWGFRYSHKSKHLCYVFFEKESLTLQIQIGKNEVGRFLSDLDTSSDKLIKAWDDRYPCGEGGWIYYRISGEHEIGEILKLVSLKKSVNYTT